MKGNRLEILNQLKDGIITPEEADKKLLEVLMSLSISQKRSIIESAQRYQKSAYSGHFAGEEPEYHYRCGQEDMLSILRKALEL